MSQHGFARDAIFDIESSTETSVRFTLRDTPESRQHYPFPFTLNVSYQLVGEEVIVTYRVHNPGETMLPFSIGGHPAFNIPFKGGAFEDYTIDFGEVRTLDRYLLEGPYLTGAYQPLGDRQYIPLTHSLFDDDALIFENVEYAALRHQPSGTAIVMESPSFTHFGIGHHPIRMLHSFVLNRGSVTQIIKDTEKIFYTKKEFNSLPQTRRSKQATPYTSKNKSNPTVMSDCLFSLKTIFLFRLIF
jgi:galactose mutarotase-like enzyme